MSLEQALKDNTDAVKENTATVRELIALLKDGNALPIGAATDKVIETAKKTPLQAGESLMSGMLREMNVPATDVPATDEAIRRAKTEAHTDKKAIDYTTDVVPVFQKLCVAKGRDAGAGILAKWNVTKLSQVPADKLAELLADIQKAAA